MYVQKNTYQFSYIFFSNSCSLITSVYNIHLNLLIYRSILLVLFIYVYIYIYKTTQLKGFQPQVVDCTVQNIYVESVRTQFDNVIHSLLRLCLL